MKKFIKSLAVAATVTIASCGAMQPAFADERTVILMELCNATADLSATHMEKIYKKMGTAKDSLKEVDSAFELHESRKLKSYIVAGIVKYSQDQTEPIIRSRRGVYELCMKDYK